MSVVGFTLTLPGIAGIVLTMGMAVNSNVLIYERIREEWRNGRTALNSIETGFKAALATVLDSNLTSLIAAVVLFGVGSGPVRGFAVTHAIGILTTMFTAFTFTRLIVAWWVRTHKAQGSSALSGVSPCIKPIRFIPDDTKIKFMRLSRYGFFLSGLLCVASILLFVFVGLNYGVDFKGGTVFVIRTEQPANLDELRSKINGLGFGDAELQEFGSPP